MATNLIVKNCEARALHSKFFRWMVPALFSAVSVCAQAGGFGFLIGNWVVDDVYCSTCQKQSSLEVGTVIEFATSSMNDPLAGGECPGKVGYRRSKMSQVTWKAISEKLRPSWFPGNALPRKGERWVATCDGMDFVSVVLLPSGDLARFDDGDSVYHLVRRR